MILYRLHSVCGKQWGPGLSEMSLKAVYRPTWLGIVLGLHPKLCRFVWCDFIPCGPTGWRNDCTHTISCGLGWVLATLAADLKREWDDLHNQRNV